MFIQGFKHATQSCTKLGGLIGRRGKELSFKRVGERGQISVLYLKREKDNFKMKDFGSKPS